MQHQFSNPHAQANFERLQGIFATLSSGDASRVAQAFADDFRLRLPFQSDGFWDRADGRDGGQRFFDSIPALFSSLRLDTTDVIEALDPDCLVVRFAADGTGRRSGKRYQNDYLGIFRFRDGLLTEWTEFHNPLRLIEAM